MDNSWSYWKSKYCVFDAFDEYYKDKCRDEIAVEAFAQAKVALYALEKRMDELAGDCDDGWEL